MTHHKPTPTARRQSRRIAGLTAAAARDGYFLPGAPKKPSASTAMTAWLKGEAWLIPVTPSSLPLILAAIEAAREDTTK